jgi:hypothetical protein
MSPKAKKSAKSVKVEDWFSDIDQEIAKRRAEITEDFKESRAKRAEINRNLISDFWRMWTTFNKSGIHFSMEPNHTSWAQFDEYPYGKWIFKPGFSPDSVSVIQLSDRTHEQGRLGDSLRAFYHVLDDEQNLRIIFEYCEGEHYYKYSGWKRIYTQHLLYDSAVDKVQMIKIHEMFKKLVKVWFESHLRRDREFFLKHLQKNYEKLKTFTQ